MRIFLVAAAFFLSQSVLAQERDFKVLRGDCAGGPTDFNELKEVRSTWQTDGTLELTAWDTETQERSVIDSSSSLDTSLPGTLRLIYRTKFTPLPPDAPVLMCEDFVKLKFFVRGVKRADYIITIEKSELVLRSGVKG